MSMSPGGADILPTASNPHVYLSCAETDRAAVEALATDLSQAEPPVPVWQAEGYMATNTLRRPEAVRQAFRAGGLVVVACFSAAGIKEPGDQNEELKYIVQERMQLPTDGPPSLIPAMFDPCKIPNISLGGGQYLDELITANLFDPSARLNRDWLINGLQRIVGRGAATTISRPAPQPSPAPPTAPPQPSTPTYREEPMAPPDLRGPLARAWESRRPSQPVVAEPTRPSAPSYREPESRPASRRLVVPDPKEVAFVSYVKEDEPQAERIYEELKADGLPVWMDKHDMGFGGDRRMQTRSVLTRDRLAFIACISAASVAREKSGQNAEIRMAIDEARELQPNSRSIIPVRLDHSNVPEFETGYRKTLAQLRGVDLFGD